MVSPVSRRRAAKHLVETKKYSVSMACQSAGVKRGTYYYQPVVRKGEQELIARLYQLVKRYPRSGYRSVTARLRTEGLVINHKRVQRLRRLEGLGVPQKQHKRRRIGSSTTVRQRALYPNRVWSWDFIFDRTEDGRVLKILNIVDEYSRTSIAMEVFRSCKGEQVIQALGRAMFTYGIPACIRSDNGSEFINEQVKKWLAENGIGISYIEPGSPWENPYVESFHARLRDESLNRELFTSILEAKVVLADWREEYNNCRPHGALGYRTPKAVYRKYMQKEKSSNLNKPNGEYSNFALSG